MTFRIHSITVDCRRWEPLVEFWAQAGGFVEDPDEPNEPGDPVGLLLDPETGLQLLFIPVPEPKAIKNRVHLDVQPIDGSRDDEVVRLASIGATVVADHRRPDGSGFVVMGDPEGNEFCVERSLREREGRTPAT